MMRVPNFIRRGEGMIVLKEIPFIEEDLLRYFCIEHTNCTNVKLL